MYRSFRCLVGCAVFLGFIIVATGDSHAVVYCVGGKNGYSTAVKMKCPGFQVGNCNNADPLVVPYLRCTGLAG